MWGASPGLWKGPGTQGTPRSLRHLAVRSPARAMWTTHWGAPSGRVPTGPRRPLQTRAAQRGLRPHKPLSKGRSILQSRTRVPRQGTGLRGAPGGGPAGRGAAAGGHLELSPTRRRPGPAQSLVAQQSSLRPQCWGPALRTWTPPKSSRGSPHWPGARGDGIPASSPTGGPRAPGRGQWRGRRPANLEGSGPEQRFVHSRLSGQRCPSPGGRSTESPTPARRTLGASRPLLQGGHGKPPAASRHELLSAAGCAQAVYTRPHPGHTRVHTHTYTRMYTLPTHMCAHHMHKLRNRSCTRTHSHIHTHAHANSYMHTCTHHVHTHVHSLCTPTPMQWSLAYTQVHAHTTYGPFCAHTHAHTHTQPIPPHP